MGVQVEEVGSTGAAQVLNKPNSRPDHCRIPIIIQISTQQKWQGYARYAQGAIVKIIYGSVIKMCMLSMNVTQYPTAFPSP
jgi:hypothetical protein